MSRIRIRQVITELRPAGAERCVYELATRLPRDRFNVSVTALRGGAMVDRLREAGVRVDALGLRGKWDVPHATRLVDSLRSDPPDVVHTHLFHADLAGRLAAALTGRVRLIHTVHVAERRPLPWRFAWAAMTMRATTCVCVSRGVREHWLRHTGLPAGRCVVIPNGVDAGRFRPDAQARRRLRSEWGVNPSDAVFAMVGRLDDQKGVDVLLDAVDSLARSGRAPDVVIAGDGPRRDLVREFIAAGQAQRRVRWLGFRDDVPDVLSAADVLVMPSRWEGFGLSAAEAMAAGLPVVASRVAGLEEVVADGRTGLLIPPGDADALTAAMIRTRDDELLRKRMGEAGRRRVERRFSIETYVRAHERLYQSIGGGKKP